MDNISAIARQGLDQAQVQLESAATKLAGAGSSLTGPNSDSVDLRTGFVDLMSVKNGFAVNISVMKIADEMQKYAIDIMA